MRSSHLSVSLLICMVWCGTIAGGGALGRTSGEEPVRSAPWIEFAMPRLPYAVQTDEIVVTNGSLSAAFVSHGNSSYLPSQLRRVLSPPFLLNNADAGTFVAWGFDDRGYHAVENQAYPLDYSVKGVAAHVRGVEWEGKTNPNWGVDFRYTALPRSRVLVITVTYENVSPEARPLKIALNLVNPQITRNEYWDWTNPAPGRVFARFNRDLAEGAIETSSEGGDAFLVFGLNGPSDSHAVTTTNEWARWVARGEFSGIDQVERASSHFQYLARDFPSVAPGQTVSVSAVLAIADSLAKARRDFEAVVGNLPERLAAADRYWDDRWNQTDLSVSTPDAGLDRMTEVATSNALTSWDELNDSWITAFSENARGCNYLWNNSYAGYGFLLSHPAMAKDTLRRLLRLDWRMRYAYSVPNSQSVGVYYAYNHSAIVELIYRYVTMTGDLAFLDEEVNGEAVISILVANIRHVHETLGFDFGAGDNLLEVVPRYVHEVPDLVAATFKMATEIAELADIIGRDDTVQEMAVIRRTAEQRTHRLWDTEARWFRTGGGELVYTVQVFNMIYSGALTSDEIAGLLEREDDFVFAHGVRSLAVYDRDYRPARIARGDWDGPGSYVGNPGNMLRALSFAGKSADVYRLAHGISDWFQWRPWQPQGIEAETGAGIGSIAENATNTSASRYLEVVPFVLLGLTYKTSGIEIHEALPVHWTNEMGKVWFGERQYCLRVRIPFLGYHYTLYADKPLDGVSPFRSATIYDAAGRLVQEVHDRKLPLLRQNLTIVLHFTP